MKILSNFSGLKAYFIGIGGISMSGLVRLLLSSGCAVEGSDSGIDNPEIDKLRGLGVQIYPTHNANNLDQDIDFVVYTLAISEDNPELQRAKSLGIPCYERAEMLGLIARAYRSVIAVSGTHGKTTTTALIGEIFKSARLKPTIHIGGVSVGLNASTIIGNKDYLILEACEYGNSFRFIASDTAVVTNIEKDHLDYYSGLDDIRDSFKHFASRSGYLVCGKGVDIEHKDMCVMGTDWEAEDVIYSKDGYDFTVKYKGEIWGKLRLNIMGEYNVTNALFAIAVAVRYGIEKSTIIRTISSFKGVERRCEKIANISGIPLIIDYAHHPTEISNILHSMDAKYRNILVIFQPHTYSRTITLFEDFVSALSDRKNLIIYTTYAAREKEILGGRAEDLVEAIDDGEYEYDFSRLVERINIAHMQGFDLVLVLGAGNLAEMLRAHYKKV